MMRRFATTMMLAVLLGTAGCASAGGGSGGSGNGAVTRQQLIDTHQPDLLQAIRSVRPQWLRARGPARLNGDVVEIQVYVNDAPYGDTNALRFIPIDTVVDVRFLSASEATTRYGLTGGAAGLIVVRTRG
jgi:hypothetical protein